MANMGTPNETEARDGASSAEVEKVVNAPDVSGSDIVCASLATVAKSAVDALGRPQTIKCMDRVEWPSDGPIDLPIISADRIRTMQFGSTNFGTFLNVRTSLGKLALKQDGNEWQVMTYRGKIVRQVSPQIIQEGLQFHMLFEDGDTEWAKWDDPDIAFLSTPNGLAIAESA